MQKRFMGLAAATLAVFCLTQIALADRPLDFMWLVRSWELPAEEATTAIGISADGKRIAIGGEYFVAAIDRETGREIWRVKDPGRAIAALHFSPDGKELIVARGWVKTGEKGLAILDAASGNTIREIAGPRFGTQDAAISADGKYILTRGGSDYDIEAAHADLYDARSGQWLSAPARDSKTNGSVRSVAFLPDGKSYLCGNARGVRMHETATGKRMKQFDGKLTLAIATSPAGERAVLCGNDGGMEVCNIADNTRHTLAVGQHISGAAFVGDELFVTWGREIRLWNARTGEEASWSGTYETEVKLGAVGKDYVVGSSGRRIWVWGLPGIGAAPVDAKPLAGVAPRAGARPTPPLVLAAERGDDARVRALLARGADVNAMRGLADRSGTTALHVAIGLPTYRALIGAGAVVNAVSAEDWNRTPLHFAVERHGTSSKADDDDFSKAIELLLDKGANIEAVFGYNQTALQTAALAGNKQLAALLQRRGAIYDLFSAAALNDMTRMRAMLTDDPALAMQRNSVKRNALYWARSREAIDLLLEAGAQINIVDAWGSSPVKDLRENRHADLAEYLETRTRK